ncbi:protein sel-1 homolog 3 isoform X2 [Oryzias melastigma]|uniref:protein sel-1 homolog 3 isoform X2 n=1 Tax=Oryzias melastigma TaxID=30732 RepID=UPI00168D246C|nr:protein sel-1 homolog 3 isoform X2 [Oryzias melastigma]
MNGIQSVSVGCVLTSCFLLGLCVFQSISAQSGEALPDNFIGFDSVPDKVADGSVVRVRFRCSGPCQLTVEVAVSTLRKTDLVVFRRKWISSAPQVHRIQPVRLRLPPSISDHHDFLNRNILDSQNVTVCAWLDYLSTSRGTATHHSSVLKVYKVLQVMPLFDWPSKPLAGCPSLSAQLVWLMTSSRIPQCPHESDVTDVLNFPLASTGEPFGLVRRFQPFINRDLERARRHAVTQPSIALSVWIYLVEQCHQNLCGIIHHIDSSNSYDSVLVQLTETGDIIIQARLTTGGDEAFRANVALPLWKWIRLDCYMLDSKIRMDASWDNKTRKFDYQFRNSLHYDDTDGYFVIGGGKYLSGIRGYFGPIKYYRLGTNEVKNTLHTNSTFQELDQVHRECLEVKAFTETLMEEVSKAQLLSDNEAACTPHYLHQWSQFNKAEKTCTQAWTWETQLKHAAFFHYLQRNQDDIRSGSLGLKQLGSVLFDLAVQSMLPVDEAQTNISSSSLAFLQVSSCFGNHRASLLLAATHMSGLGLPVSRVQGHVYSLIGALGDDRFALMHVGYKHSLGADGFPKDLDVAYGYYSNVGAQSSIDHSQAHEMEQYIPEHIYLSNEEDLKSLTHESSDVFQYLEFQAERGDVEAQRRLGIMLYWGHNRVSKDIASAVKWFERSAVEMKDPSAMYDYSILLMKGQGVKRNYTRGFRLLKEAAALGSINALNGLGWYHGKILKDYKNAVKYFEQAASNGSDDGMFNLGIYHLTGKIPDRPWRNEFLNASRLGHVGASVEAAWYLSTGNLEGVSQDVERAVIMLRKVCEQNGHLGFMVREGLQAFLQDSREEALLKYILAAETGLTVAQTNAAHLCEELSLGYDCQWRYYNYSILNSQPHPSALLKMGDYYSSRGSRGAREDSLSSAERAVSMYSRAAHAGSPQGMYSLAALAQRGHILPAAILHSFNASLQDEPDSVMEKILRRCVEMEDEEAITPCSLALLGLQTGKALRKMTQNGAQLLLAYASLLSVFVLAVIMPLQSHFGSAGFPPRRRRTSSGSPYESREEGDGAEGGRWLTENGELWLRQAGDVAVTVAGVCLCVFWITLVYHLL